jgi:hypothetical protein
VQSAHGSLVITLTEGKLETILDVLERTREERRDHGATDGVSVKAS